MNIFAQSQAAFTTDLSPDGQPIVADQARLSIQRSSLLVVGYGNDLRGDDAVGPLVTQVVVTWHIPGVVVLTLPQLLPELAAMLAACEKALFVDAQLVDAQQDCCVSLHSLALATEAASLGHTSDPCQLLALTQALYGVCPQAWRLTIPGVDFGLGAPVSSVAQRGMEDALKQIRLFLAC